MYIEFATNLSHIIASITFFGLFLLFADSLLLRFDLKTFLKSSGFLIFSIASFFTFTTHGGNDMTLWASITSFVLIFVGFLLEPHSILKWGAILIIPAFIFLQGHFLLFVLGIFIAIVIFQLVYSTSHSDLIPLGVSFVLVTMGEYFYSLQGHEGFGFLYIAGCFLYLFASFILLFWLWSYLALRVKSLIWH